MDSELEEAANNVFAGTKNKKNKGRDRNSKDTSKTKKQFNSSINNNINQNDPSNNTEIFGDADSRRRRFEKKVDATTNLDHLKNLRDQERKNAIFEGLIDDPSAPKNLAHARKVIGTCTNMCPIYEIELRKHQLNVDKRELDANTGLPDNSKFVKAFHRPAAGMEQALPSDIRPPDVLKATLDYLFGTVLSDDYSNLADSHSFLRDRTRSIRQDFTLQSYHGPEAIDCHERIARYHILCLHQLKDSPDFSEQQEVEQLQKVLKSLLDFYTEARSSSSACHYPNEAEFRSYYLCLNLLNAEILVDFMRLPTELLSKPYIQNIIRLKSYIQKIADLKPNSSQNDIDTFNFYTKYFKGIADPNITYLQACVAENLFLFTRKRALSAMRQSYLKAHNAIPLSDIQRALAFDSVDEAASFCSILEIELLSNEGELKPSAAVLHKISSWDDSKPHQERFSKILIDSKLKTHSYKEIINGEIPAPKLMTIRRSISRHNVLPKTINIIKDSFLKKPQKLILTPPPQSIPNVIPSFPTNIPTFPGNMPTFSDNIPPLPVVSPKLPTNNKAKPVQIAAEKDPSSLQKKQMEKFNTALDILSKQIYQNVSVTCVEDFVFDTYASYLNDLKLLRKYLRYMKAEWLRRYIQRKEQEELETRNQEKLRQHSLTLNRLAKSELGDRSIYRPRKRLHIANECIHDKQNENFNENFWSRLSTDWWESQPLVEILQTRKVKKWNLFIVCIEEAVLSWFERKFKTTQFSCKQNVEIEVNISKSKIQKKSEIVPSASSVIFSTKYDPSSDTRTFSEQRQEFLEFLLSCRANLKTMSTLLIICWTTMEIGPQDDIISALGFSKVLANLERNPFNQVKYTFLYSTEDARIHKFIKEFEEGISLADTPQVLLEKDIQNRSRHLTQEMKKASELKHKLQLFRSQLNQNDLQNTRHTVNSIADDVADPLSRPLNILSNCGEINASFTSSKTSDREKLLNSLQKAKILLGKVSDESELAK